MGETKSSVEGCDRPPAVASARGSSAPGRPYPSLSRLAVIGDRRTAAAISADGTICWFCLPNFDGTPVFGCLLDAARGGGWRLGPADYAIGRQSYRPDNNLLVTTWRCRGGELELSDAMLSPDEGRPAAGVGKRTLIRRLRCSRGLVKCTMRLAPRADFNEGPITAAAPRGLELRVGGFALGLWCSHPLKTGAAAVTADFMLADGEEFWVVLGLNEDPGLWDVRAAEHALQDTIGYWEQRKRRYDFHGPRRDRVIRSALALELLSFAPTGAIVAAATSSLPERVGADRNYDYRYAWIRDASMALATLSVLGDLESAERYLSWLSQLRSTTQMPLQVLYRADGGTETKERTRDELCGYRGSRPVRFGNHAYRQRQIDSLGYVADCAVIYLDAGGRWAPEYWQLMCRIADYSVRNWRKPSNGIWERDEQRHFVSSKVMSWTTLKRVLEFADRTGDTGNLRRWRKAMTHIHAEVMTYGWSDKLQAFRQHYKADTLDASALLIPLMGFLGPDHPRVVATVRRIEQDLVLDGLVHRFQPEDSDLPVGEFEGAFLPCCFWLAAVYALMGRTGDAEAMLQRTERLCGDTGMFSEEADSRTGEMLGNIPMIFSHAEYARAVLQLANRWPRGI